MFSSKYEHQYVVVLLTIFIPSALQENPGPCRIPGTKLNTKTWYTIQMKGYSSGFVVPIVNNGSFRKGAPTKWWLFHVFNLKEEDLANYEKGGKDHSSIKWRFVQALEDRSLYKLENAGLIGKGYVTWSISDFLNNLVVTKYPTFSSSHLMKPVVKERSDGVEYHILVFEEYHPLTHVGWFERTENSHYLRTYNTAEPYEKCSKEYDRTLFMFIEDNESSEDFETCDASEDDQDLHSEEIFECKSKGHVLAIFSKMEAEFKR